MLKICLTVLAQLPIVAPRCPPSGQAAKQYGEVSEWLKEHAWKVCIRQRIGGSNPPLTAIFKMRARTKVRAFFFYILRKGVDENPRLGFDNWRQPVGQTESIANRLPAGRAKRVNPPRCDTSCLTYKKKPVQKHGPVSTIPQLFSFPAGCFPSGASLWPIFKPASSLRSSSQ